MADKPLWRRAVDSVDAVIAPHLEEFATSTFVDITHAVRRVQNGVRGWADRRSRVMWHLLNLPAGSDIKRLSRQVASLDRELRQLRGELNGEIEDGPHGRDS
jgi:hypothetical protein